MPLEAVKDLGGLEVVVNNQAEALSLEGGAHCYLEGQAGPLLQEETSRSWETPCQDKPELQPSPLEKKLMFGSIRISQRKQVFFFSNKETR